VPRALSVEWVDVDPSAEPEFSQKWRARRHQLAADGCHHWIFRSQVESTRFLEFIEAGDAASLSDARQRAGMRTDAEILIEVELS
jgi:hypothetical protein